LVVTFEWDPVSEVLMIVFCTPLVTVLDAMHNS